MGLDHSPLYSLTKVKLFYNLDLRHDLVQNLSVTAARVVAVNIALLLHLQAQAHQLRARNVERVRAKNRAVENLQAAEVDRELVLVRGPGNWMWVLSLVTKKQQ